MSQCLKTSAHSILSSMTSTFDIMLFSRRVLVAALSVLMGVGMVFYIVEFPIKPLIAILIFGAVLDGIWQFIVPVRLKQRPVIVFSHLSSDVIFLGLFVALTGGGMSPFSSLFLVPIILGTVVLPLPLAIGLLAWTVMCYLGVAMFHIPMLFYEQSMDTMMHLHFLGMMFSFILIAVLITVFVSRLIRRHQEALRQLAESNALLVIESQFAKMGVMATTAAHELNTPLSTLSLIADELQDSPLTPDQVSLVATMNAQILRCKTGLAQVLSSFGVFSANSVTLGPLNQHLDKVIFSWKASNELIQLDFDNLIPTVSAVTDRYLGDIITHLLDNAAAQSQTISCCAYEKNKGIVIEIQDQGPGMSAELLQKLSNPLIEQFLEFQSSTHGKRGLGLILTQFLVQRLGGGITFDPKTVDSSGQKIQIVIPLKNLQGT